MIEAEDKLATEQQKLWSPVEDDGGEHLEF